MGEFFRVIWEEDGKRDIFTFGGKLMEGAYIDNKRFEMLVDHVAKIKKPVRIAVLGDSSNKAFSYNKDSLSPSLLDELYRETWRRNYDGENDAAEPSPVHRFIFNHTKHLVLDMVDAVFLTGYLEGRDKRNFPRNRNGRYMLGEFLESGTGALPYDPLIILTAVACGDGSASYDGIAGEYFGSWAWDEITVSDDYKDLYKLDYARFNIAFTCYAGNPDRARQFSSLQNLFD